MHAFNAPIPVEISLGISPDFVAIATPSRNFRAP
jgi:hypothetical protein